MATRFLRLNKQASRPLTLHTCKNARIMIEGGSTVQSIMLYLTGRGFTEQRALAFISQ